jgi:hypothetical protein
MASPATEKTIAAFPVELTPTAGKSTLFGFGD